MKKLTMKQKEILAFLRDYIDTNGYPPSVREIGKAVGLSSTSSVHAQLSNLENKGYIRKSTETSRGIQIVSEKKPQYTAIPMVGLVTAGNPIEAIEDVSEYFPIPNYLVHSDDVVFALKVSGDSMKNAGIYDQDTIIVRKSDVASNGEIIVALTDDNEATVKRFYKEKDHFRLQPENEAYEPIIVRNVKVVGKVIAVFRDLS